MWKNFPYFGIIPMYRHKQTVAKASDWKAIPSCRPFVRRRMDTVSVKDYVGGDRDKNELQFHCKAMITRKTRINATSLSSPRRCARVCHSAESCGRGEEVQSGAAKPS